MTAALAQVPVEHLDHYWHRVEPYLRRAHERMGFTSPADWYKRLKAGKCDLWLVFVAGHLRAAFVTSVRGETLVVECLGGDDMLTWIDLLDDLESQARDNGMTSIEFEGRPGWAWLKRKGYATRRVVLGKEL